MADIGQIIGEKYRLERVLGEGGMGAVFEAVHIHIGSKVAIKFLHPGFSENSEAVERFQREAQMAAGIGHDAIVRINDLGNTADGSQYLVMEALKGASLADRLIHGPISLSMTAYIGCQVLSGLHAAHEAGIIHRDMKPDNIYLVETGAMLPGVKILDFGISRVTGIGGGSEDVARLTRTGIVLGTPAYMSPEHARGRADIDHRSDIFSVGIILYECLTGELPFNGDNYNAILAEIIIENPPSPSLLDPDIPPHLEELILKALEKNREERYQSAWELFDELIPFVEESAVGRIPIPTGLESVPTSHHEGLASTKPVPLESAKTTLRPADMSLENSQPMATAPTIAEPEGARDTDNDRALTRSGFVRRVAPLAIIVGAVVVLLAIGAVVWAMLGSGDSDSQLSVPDAMVTLTPNIVPEKISPEVVRGDASPSKEGAVPPVPETSRIDLVGVPRSAKIMLDGTSVPHSDLPLKLRKGGPHHRLKVVLEGHEPFNRWINPSQSQKINVVLAPRQANSDQPDAGEASDEGQKQTGSRPTGPRHTGSRPTGPRRDGKVNSGSNPSKNTYRPNFID